MDAVTGMDRELDAVVTLVPVTLCPLDSCEPADFASGAAAEAASRPSGPEPPPHPTAIPHTVARTILLNARAATLFDAIIANGPSSCGRPWTA
jgi:hypothetical protein